MLKIQVHFLLWYMDTNLISQWDKKAVFFNKLCDEACVAHGQQLGWHGNAAA